METLKADLVLTEYKKSKKTDAQPGYKIKLSGEIDDAQITPDNIKDPKAPLHGKLKLVVPNLFDGKRELEFTGKLRRDLVHAKKNTPAHQVWDFRLAERPAEGIWKVIIELGDQDGDENTASVHAEFNETEEPKKNETREPDGPELFENQEVKDPEEASA